MSTEKPVKSEVHSAVMQWILVYVKKTTYGDLDSCNQTVYICQWTKYNKLRLTMFTLQIGRTARLVNGILSCRCVIVCCGACFLHLVCLHVISLQCRFCLLQVIMFAPCDCCLFAPCDCCLLLCFYVA